MFIQRAIVPHEEAKGWVKLADVVRPADPRLLLSVRGQAVATVRIAGSHNKHIVWNGLERRNFRCENTQRQSFYIFNVF